MTDVEKREAERQFINRWMGRGNEDEQAPCDVEKLICFKPVEFDRFRKELLWRRNL